MAQPQPISITSAGHFHPPNLIANSFFDELDIGSDGSWVCERTGIESRHSVLTKDDIIKLRQKNTTTEELREQGRIMSIADMSERAWQSLTSRRPFKVNDLDMLVCGTSVPDFDIPANASSIAAKIGAECFCFDANSACSSFVVGLHVARHMMLSGSSQKSALFTPERYSIRLDYSDKSSCVLFGDGCSAALLESNAEEGLEVLDTIVVSSPGKYDLVQIPESGKFFQNGRAVQKFAISRTIEITQEILTKNGYSVDDVNYLIGHQANLRMVTAAVSKLGLDPNKHLYNVDKRGNQGGAGAPCVLSENWDKFKSGDLVVVSVVGSGLTWASALLRKK